MFPKGTEDMFARKAYDRFGGAEDAGGRRIGGPNCFAASKKQRVNLQFEIQHYAGKVF
jgi:hypothetical protein